MLEIIYKVSEVFTGFIDPVHPASTWTTVAIFYVRSSFAERSFAVVECDANGEPRRYRNTGVYPVHFKSAAYAVSKDKQKLLDYLNSVESRTDSDKSKEN